MWLTTFHLKHPLRGCAFHNPSVSLAHKRIVPSLATPSVSQCPFPRGLFFDNDNSFDRIALKFLFFKFLFYISNLLPLCLRVSAIPKYECHKSCQACLSFMRLNFDFSSKVVSPFTLIYRFSVPEDIGRAGLSA